MKPYSGDQAEGCDSEPRPWDQPGQVRRDCEPHWGDLLMLLGAISLGCGLLSCLVVPALVGVALGFTVLEMARRDLNRMGAGQMDPAGKGLAEKAMGLASGGIVGSLLGGPCGLGWLSRLGIPPWWFLPL